MLYNNTILFALDMLTLNLEANLSQVEVMRLPFAFQALKTLEVNAYFRDRDIF